MEMASDRIVCILISPGCYSYSYFRHCQFINNDLVGLRVDLSLVEILFIPASAFDGHVGNTNKHRGISTSINFNKASNYS
jgi:hypothetical protein